MTLDEIERQLTNLRKPFPAGAVRAAIEQQEAITPVLLAALERAATDPADIAADRDAMLHTYAVFLLAQFREPAAYPPLVKLCSVPGDDLVFDILGDVVTEDLDRILASVCGSDLELLQRMIESPSVNEYVRGAGMRALTVLVAMGAIERDTVVDYFRSLFHGHLQAPTELVWSNLVCAAMDIHPAELMDEIEQAFSTGRADPYFVSLSSVQAELARSKADVLGELKRRTGYIIDTVAEMRGWACFRPGDPMPRAFPSAGQRPVITSQKVGRNEPCPCGSGKKYKKCCLY